MSRIDEKTVVPLGWVLALFSTGIATAAAAAFWVSAVNNRLARIEDKLGISAYDSGVPMRSSHAGER